MTSEATSRWVRRAKTALGNPAYAVRRLWLFAYELTHPGEPWIASGAVRFCERHATREWRVLEWGSGRSTLWFAERVGRLLSVEHDRAWFDRMAPSIRARRNVDYRHVPLDHDASAPTWRSYDPQPRYVAVADELPNDSLDLVIVDGHYRQACVRAALSKLKPGGLLLIDNYDRMTREEWGVPASFELSHSSQNAMTQTAIWTKR